MFVLHFLQCDPATHNARRPMPEFDVLMSPAVDQLTTDPLVELNGIMYVLAFECVKCLLISPT